MEPHALLEGREKWGAEIHDGGAGAARATGHTVSDGQEVLTQGGFLGASGRAKATARARRTQVFRRIYLTAGKHCGMIPVMGKKRGTITEAVRRAIEESGLSRYAIAKASGVTQAALSRFVAGKRGLTTDTLDRLADVLGLEIVVRKRGRGK